MIFSFMLTSRFTILVNNFLYKLITVVHETYTTVEGQNTSRFWGFFGDFFPNSESWFSFMNKNRCTVSYTVPGVRNLPA